MWRILLGIVYLTAFCEASEYIFSYRVAARNGMLLNEKYYFSPAMVGANILRQTKNPYKNAQLATRQKLKKLCFATIKRKF